MDLENMECDGQGYVTLRDKANGDLFRFKPVRTVKIGDHIALIDPMAVDYWLDAYENASLPDRPGEGRIRLQADCSEDGRIVADVRLVEETPDAFICAGDEWPKDDWERIA